MIKSEFMSCNNCNHLGFNSTSRDIDINNNFYRNQNNYNTKRKLDNIKINNFKKEAPSFALKNDFKHVDSTNNLHSNSNEKIFSSNNYYSKIFLNSKLIHDQEKFKKQYYNPSFDIQSSKLIEEQKFNKKKAEFENKPRISKSTYNINTNMNNTNGAFCFSGSKKLMKLNSGAILNSLADYNLANLEDKMLQLDIGYLKSQQFQQQRNEMFKNVSFDSLNNLKNRKNNKKFNFNDQFEAYRLENDSIENKNETETNETKKDIFISEENKTTSVIIKNSSTNENKTEIETNKTKKKTNRHHHHRKRHNNKNKEQTNQDSMKKSKSNIDETNSVVLEQINQDSLSAFDFSNTDEFWEDDIVTNSELIGTESFHLRSGRNSPISHFISIDIEDDSI